MRECAIAMLVLWLGQNAAWPSAVRGSEVEPLPAITLEQSPTSPPQAMQHMHAPSDLPAPQAVEPVGATLDQVEAIALTSNPTLREVEARLASAQGVALQAGLYPNPTIGYSGELIGAAGTAGEFQGAYVRQTIVTARKLQLSRSKYLQEVAQNQLHALAQRERVLNGVRIHYVRLLAAQRLYDVEQQLLRNAEDAELTTKEMVNLGQANHAEYLQAQVTARRKRVELEQTRYRVEKARRDLAAFIGIAELPPGRVQGSLEQPTPRLKWNEALEELLAYSPELAVAKIEIRKDQIQLRREIAQPYPNIQLQGAAGYNFENPSSVANANIGLDIPLFNRNQGTIRQAQAEVARASAEANRVALSLRHRLAEQFRRYEAALTSVVDFEAKSLEDARRAFQLLLEGYKQRRAPWTEVLQAERIYIELSHQYVHDLRELREAEITIKGLLLVGGLEAPGAPVGNHIDATPQPR